MLTVVYNMLNTFSFTLLITTCNLVPHIFFTTRSLGDLIHFQLHQHKPGGTPLKSVNFVGVKTGGSL